MKKIYKNALLVWLILPFVAILNATIREVTYKPLLEPYIGMWAHQISIIPGIFLFLLVTILFLKNTKAKYNKKDLLNIGLIWFILTILFEFIFGKFIMKKSWEILFLQYNILSGDLWIILLITIIFLPKIAEKIIKRKRK